MRKASRSTWRGRVHDLYFQPVHEQFQPRTMWNLSNAFTSAFKELDPIPHYKATAKLAGISAISSAILKPFERPIGAQVCPVALFDAAADRARAEAGASTRICMNTFAMWVCYVELPNAPCLIYRPATYG